MSRHQLKLTAGQRGELAVEGSNLVILDTGAAATIELQVWFQSKQAVDDHGSVKKNWNTSTRGGPAMQGVYMKSAVDTTVDFYVGELNVDPHDFDTSGSVATIDPSQLPLPVDVQSSITLNVHDTTPAATQQASYGAAVAVDDVGVSLLAAGAYARVSVRNSDPVNKVAIYRGAANVPYAECAIVLAPGDVYIEQGLAANGQAFRAVCATGLTATVAVEKWA